MQLFKSALVVCDVETSGLLNQRWASVVELGGVILDVEGEEVDTFHTIVRPVHPLPSTGREAAEVDKALSFSGITRAQIETAPAADTVHGMWSSWVDEFEVRYFTSYNEAFDRPMMEDRLGLRKMLWAPCIMEAAIAIMGPAGVLDPSDPTHYNYDEDRPWLFPPLTRKQRTHRDGKPLLDADGQPMWKMGAADFFGVHIEHQTHRALDDCRTAAAVLIEIRKRQLQAAARAA